MLPTKFQVKWPFCSVEEVKNRFSRWRPPWISDRNNFSYFWSTSHPDASYQVASQLAFSFRRRREKLIFKMATMVAILDFRLEWLWLLLIYKSSPCFLPSFKSIGLIVQENKWKIDFQDGHRDSHLGFLIRMILAIFALQVTPMLPTKFQVNLPFYSGEEAKNRFSRWPSRRPSRIYDRNDFSYFWPTSRTEASCKVSSQLAQVCRRSRFLMPHRDDAR